MPLLGRLEDDFLVPGSNDEYLRVTELGDVENGMWGFVGVCAEKSGAGGSSPIPLIWLRSRLLGLLEGLFEVGNRVWFVIRVIAGVLYLEGPEVEDEPGPEPMRRSAGNGLPHHRQITYAACPFSLVAQAPTPSFAPIK